MTKHPWIRKLLGRSSPRRTRQRHLVLDALETRTVPTISLGSAATFSAGNQPRAVAVGDFNADNKLDLAVANFGGNNGLVLLGVGDGTFTTGSTFATGTGPTALVVGDFNADGRPDIATGNQTSNNVTVVLGNGSGGFGTGTNYNVGNTPTALAAADFNGDTRLDLVVANSGANNASLLRGNADGTFLAATTINTSIAPVTIAVGDLDGDARQDVIVADNIASNNVAVLIGNGNATFDAADLFTFGASPVAVVGGDFNRDGDLDVATASSTSAVVRLGRGDGNFDAATTFTVGTTAVFLASSDLDRDGYADLVSANSGGNNISVLAGSSTGITGTATNLSTGASTSPRAVAMGDFNGDGRPDLVTANNGTNNVSVFLNNSTFAAPTITTLAPTSANEGRNPFTLTVNGTNFVPASVIRWNGADLATTFVNNTRLTTSIPTSLVPDNGTAAITVFTPTPGGGTSAAATFTINNANPNITATIPSAGTEGTVINLTETATDAGGVNDPLTFGWTVTRPDGTTFTLSGATASFTPDDNGTYAVTGTVTDDDGGSDTQSRNINVANVAPTGTLANNGPLAPNSPATVTLGNVSDPSTADTTAGFRYSFALTTAGLATTYAAAGTANTANFTFATPGTYTVMGRVFDKNNGNTTYSTTITVADLPTVASLSPSSANEGASDITLTVTGTNFNNTAVVQWDSTSLTTTFVSSTQVTAQVPASLLSDDGSASVRVSISIGSSDAQTFTINNVAPTITTFAVPNTDTEGSSIDLSASATDPAGAADPLTYTWTITLPDSTTVQATGANTNFVPDDNGDYLVGLTVSDGDGGSVTQSATISVSNVAPTATLSNNGPINEGALAVVSFANASDPSAADGAAGSHYSFATTADALASDYATAGMATSANFSNLPPGSTTIFGRILDKDGGATDYTTTVVVNNGAPTIDRVTIAPSPVDEGSLVSLEASATDPGGSTGLTYTWTITRPDSTTFTLTGASTGFTPQDGGVHGIALEVRDTNNGSATATASLTVNNVAPSATLGNNGPVAEGSAASVSFANATDPSSSDTAAGFRYSFALNVADLATTYAAAGTSDAANFTLPDDGTYTIHGRVFDQDNGFTEYTTSVVVTNVAPTITTFTVPATGPEGSAVSLSAAASDPAGGADPRVFTWTITQPNSTTFTVSGANTSFTPDDNGSFHVSLTVSDGDGGTATQSADVGVTNVAPTATLSNNGPVAINSPVTASFTSPSDPSGADTTAGFRYSFATSVAGLATSYAAASAATTQSFTFSTAGTPTIFGRVIDKDGGSTDHSTVVTVNNTAPTLTSVTPTTLAEGSSGNLITATGANFISTSQIAWNGTPLTTTFVSATQLTATLSPGLATDNGTANITVVTPGVGTSETRTITITNEAPTITTFTVPTTDPEGTAVNLSAAATDPAGGTDPLVFTWTITRPNSTTFTVTGANASFTPDDNGTYSASLTVSDGDGGVATQSANVGVTNVAPTATLSNNGPVGANSPVTASFTSPSDPSGADTTAGFRYSFATSVAGLATSYGAASASTTQSFTFITAGAPTIFGRIFDKDGGSTDHTTVVTVNDTAPTLTSVTPPSLAEGSSGNLITATGTNYTSASQIAWNGTPLDTNFVSSTQLTATLPVGLATDDGAANITVVTPGVGTSGTRTIAITNVAPTITTFSVPATGSEGTAVNLSAAATDPAGGVDPLVFTWTITRPNNTTFTVSGASANFTPDDNGTYNASLTVSDGDGGMATQSANVSVTNVAPTATLSNNGPVGVNSPVTASFTNPSDPSSADTTAGFRYSFATSVAGLATSYGAASASTTQSFLFSTAGTPTIFGRIFDQDGDSTDHTTVVTVSDNAPTLTSVTPSTLPEGSSGDLITVTGTNFSALSQIAWNGTLLATNFLSATQLSATLPAGLATDNGTAVIAVTTPRIGSTNTLNVPITNVAPTLVTFVVPTTVTLGDMVSLSASATDPAGNADPLVFSWTITRPDSTTFPLTGVSPSFTPTMLGNHGVALVVTDGDGGSVLRADGSVTVGVGPGSGQTISTFIVPATAVEGSPVALQAATTGGAGTPSFQWTITRPNGSTFSLTGASTTFTPDDNGPYAVQLSVQAGGTATRSASVSVANVAPTATFVNNGPKNLNQAVTVTFREQFELSTPDSAAGLRYSYALTAAGLATSYTAAVPDESTTFRFSAPGNPTVFGRVFDKDNGFTTYSTSFTVGSSTLQFNEVRFPSEALAGSTLTLASSATGTGTLSYLWNITTPDGGVLPLTGASINFTPSVAGLYRVNLEVRDGAGRSITTAGAILVHPVGATPTNLRATFTPASISEGGSTTLTGSFNDLDAGNHQVVIRWGDGTADTLLPLGPGVFGFSANHVYANNPGNPATGSFAASIRVVNAVNRQATLESRVTVNNVAPVVAPATGDSVGVRGQTLSVAADFTDAGVRDTHTASINWGDGSTSSGVVVENLGLGRVSASHVYAATGTYPVRITVRDREGASMVVTRSLQVLAVNLAPDPLQPSVNALFVSGTASADRIDIGKDTAGRYTTRIETGSTVSNGLFTGPLSRVVVYGGSGNDTITIAPAVDVPAWLFGGQGNDMLTGGSVRNVLVGSNGDDRLIGGSARDILIGGIGVDRLEGGGEDDLLIAGLTAFDQREDALAALLLEWSRTDVGYAVRLSHLRDGSDGRLNGTTLLNNATVADTHRNERLSGGAATDLFYSGAGDVLEDVLAGEAVVSL